MVSRQFSAYVDYKIIKTHARSYGNGVWTTDESDYAASALHYLDNNADKCLGIAKDIGEATYQVISRCIVAGSRIGLRKAQAVLRLRNKHNGTRLEAACLRAITFDNYEYKSISKILDDKLDQQSTQSFGTHQITEDSAYIRHPDEYSSSMEVNYA